MGLLSSLTEIVTSGVTWALNKIMKAGGWAVAGLVALSTWITGTLGGLLTGLLTPLFANIPGISDGMPAFGVWAIGLFVQPELIPIFAALVIRFIIRRLPVVG